MISAIEQLTRLVGTVGRYDTPLSDLLPIQIEAARERLAAHSQSIALLRNRIEETGVKRIDGPADIVPLLLAHSAYKSYPESWLAKARWDVLGTWLDSVSSWRIDPIDTKSVDGIDDWIRRLAERGRFLNCSSGSTGKISMVPTSRADRDMSRQVLPTALEWGTGLKANKEHRLFICNPASNNVRYIDSWDALITAFGEHGDEYRLPGEAITVGKVHAMVSLRKHINEGKGRPEDLAALEALSKSRQQAMDDSVTGIAEALVASRGRRIMIAGMYALMFKVAQMVREMGYGSDDFHPDNAMMVSGGLKGADLPPDYREFIQQTFNVPPRQAFEMYGMQEVNSFFPRCTVGRYHTPPWVMLLPLDRLGEQLAGPPQGELEGRAAFFDLSHDGRWGGLISGDKVHVDYGRCACGHIGPTIGQNITRYADLPDGDKISCAGTIDAYVRGMA